MPIALSTFWWVLAGLAVIAELLTGTLYLLLVGVGLAAGALAAHAGTGLVLQICLAAAVGAAAVLLLRQARKRHPRPLRSEANPDVNLDIGEVVQVDHWNDDGTASVFHRGARWTVVARLAGPQAPGPHRVSEVVGSRLVVDPA
jgi:membrane protein implicated in regulation of membrane protease activity